jgi:signal transduction histidine kinase
MTTVAEISASRADVQGSNAARIAELGRIIQVYSDLTDKLQQSHSQLQLTVQSLRNELSDKNRQLERKKRLAALGEMAAGMAHEIRNPLGGIELYASMLAKDLWALPASLQLVTKISSGVKRLEGLVSQVLQFSREISPQIVTADLGAIVDQSVEFAADRIGPSLVCHATGPRPMLVGVDPLLIGQAILNLTINAIEAIGEDGIIEINWSPLEDERSGQDFQSVFYHQGIRHGPWPGDRSSNCRGTRWNHHRHQRPAWRRDFRNQDLTAGRKHGSDTYR